MKRDPALAPLTHDHHHALVHARRLRLAAAGEASEREAATRAFVAFFDAETVTHFREEEELLLPLIVEAAGTVPALVERVLLDHVEIHTLLLGLRRGLAQGIALAGPMGDVARRLEAHIRLEEREVFPLAEQTVAHEALAGLHFTPRHRGPPDR
ncbi:MAG: hemerythrin domain-containing protein [Actinomycetota bacterium]